MSDGDVTLTKVIRGQAPHRGQAGQWFVTYGKVGGGLFAVNRPINNEQALAVKAYVDECVDRGETPTPQGVADVLQATEPQPRRRPHEGRHRAVSPTD